MYVCIYMYVSEVALNFNFFCHFDGQGRKIPSSSIITRHFNFHILAIITDLICFYFCSHFHFL